jgi:Ca2+-binding RTX toxin-like protein
MPEFGTGPDTLTLHLSADQFQGAPHLNFYVIDDGHYVGNLAEWQQVTAAAHSGGDTFTLHGDWNNGDALGITYIDDNGARAAYLDSAEINGVAIPGAKLDMLTAGEWGPIAFNGDAVVSPPPPGTGSQTLRGTASADTLTGGDGDDRISGLGGDDKLSGGAGNDYLAGGTGTDNIDGGVGNDWLISGTARDVLTGGAGADIFVIIGTDQGQDTITDFNAADGDRVDLHAVLGAFGHNATDLTTGGFIRLVDATGGVRLDVDEDGGANGFVAVAQFSGHTAADIGANWLIA